MSRFDQYDRTSERLGYVRGGLALVAAGLGVVGLITQCSADYDGAEDSFKFTGVVIATEEHEIETRIVSIDEMNGTAVGLLATGQTVTVFDEYRHPGFWNCEWEDIGKLTDMQDQPIEENQLEAGDRVEFEGRIRDSLDTCGKNKRISARIVYEQGTQIAG